MSDVTSNPCAPAGRNPNPMPNWEREVIEKLVTAGLTEQRRARRWSIFFKFALMIYLLMLLVLYLPWSSVTGGLDGDHTALVDVEGVISSDSDASADRVITALRAAFESENTIGVIMRINSPGGSPVQAGYINDEIVRLREIHPEIPLYAVITDVCASGGYYVAAAADEVYADKSSLVGSIGVLSNGFGFVGTMELLGVERRLFTAGESKGFLDPFSPLKPTDVAHFQDVLSEMHQQFIEVVRSGRGDRLADDEKLFSGLVWSGAKSVDLGLVDGLGSSSYVAREIIGAENIVDFTSKRGILEKWAQKTGATMARAFWEQVSSSGLRLP